MTVQADTLEALLGKVVQTLVGLSWTVRGDVTKAEVVADRESELPVGVKIFDFNKKVFRVPTEDSRGSIFCIFSFTWGLETGGNNWNNSTKGFKQVMKSKQQTQDTAELKKIHDISECEFWKSWVVLLAARIEGKQGGQLWQKR